MERVLFLILSILLGGLVIGGLGRLVVPGPNPIGLGWTLVCGIGGAVIGGLIARGLFSNVAYPASHWFVAVVLEVLAAALLVLVVTRARRGRPHL
jgi:uncharacterized membrane protein YeaQ/YmgE (transglycosylase-associated protein family)